jgi:hypothetical protein
MSVTTSAGTITLNDLETDVLGPGNGYLVQEATGVHYPAVRNPVDNRPNQDGGLLHPFQKGAKYMRIAGLIISVSPVERASLDDRIKGYLDPLLREDGSYTWSPVDGGDRTHTVRLFSEVEISGESGTGGMTAGPKMFEFTLVAANPEEVPV